VNLPPEAHSACARHGAARVFASQTGAGVPSGSHRSHSDAALDVKRNLCFANAGNDCSLSAAGHRDLRIQSAATGSSTNPPSQLRRAHRQSHIGRHRATLPLSLIIARTPPFHVADLGSSCRTPCGPGRPVLAHCDGRVNEQTGLRRLVVRAAAGTRRRGAISPRRNGQGLPDLSNRPLGFASILLGSLAPCGAGRNGPLVSKYDYGDFPAIIVGALTAGGKSLASARGHRPASDSAVCDAGRDGPCRHMNDSRSTRW